MMWINCRWKMLRRVQLMRLCLIVLICNALVSADRSTIERIRKHREWLKQRNHERTNNSPAERQPKTAFELANLWRFQKHNAADAKPSLNEVYPENETSPTSAPLTSGYITTTATAPTPTITTAVPAVPATTTTTATSQLTSTRTTTAPQFPPITTDQPIDTALTATPTTVAPTSSAPSTTEALRTTTTTTTTSATVTTPVGIRISTSTSQPTTSSARKSRTKTRPYPRWGNWGRWSDCSRSCGGGVRHQQRKCINRNSSTGRRYISNACIGVYKRFHICNEQPCAPGRADFRAQQCAAYNDVDFQGHKYTWEPYIKDDAECELNCKPLGMKYFATLNASVIDGTVCYRPAEYYRSNYRERAMCVGGICKQRYFCKRPKSI